MNGEIQQASSIVIAARKALFEKSPIDFTPAKHIRAIQFVFAPRSWFGVSAKAKSVEAWFDLCRKRGLKDIKFIVPSGRKNRHLLGFANTSQCVIVCCWENGKTSHFCPFWEYDAAKEGWRVVYNEQYVAYNAFENLRFTEKTDEFKDILLKIGRFAAELDFSYFAGVFQDSYEVLNASKCVNGENIPTQLPDEFKPIYYAVEKADEFGAMGSWNDSPPCYAQEKGREKEYEELSNELLVQIRYHLMYVTNECWK
jgi:hypothetical protein